MRIFIEQTDERTLSRWRQVTTNVGRLQERIYRQGLSRMKREFHVRFLGGWGAVMRPGYPAGRASTPATLS